MAEVWRTGRKVGRTIYRQTGPDSANGDVLIGLMDTPELARQAVEAVNGQTPRVRRLEAHGRIDEEKLRAVEKFRDELIAGTHGDSVEAGTVIDRLDQILHRHQLSPPPVEGPGWMGPPAERRSR